MSGQAQGAAESEAGQLTVTHAQAAALTATGNLFADVIGPNGVAGLVPTDGYNGALYLVIQKTGSGTVTVNPQTNWDGGTTFYNAGYQQVDNVASPARAVGAFSIGAGAVNHVLQLLDGAPLMQFVATVTGSVSVNAYLYKVPV